MSPDVGEVGWRAVDAEERREQRRRRAERRAAEEREAAQYQLPKDLPLEDIAKEMQDSWQLKVPQGPRPPFPPPPLWCNRFWEDMQSVG